MPKMKKKKIDESNRSWAPLGTMLVVLDIIVKNWWSHVEPSAHRVFQHLFELVEKHEIDGNYTL